MTFYEVCDFVLGIGVIVMGFGYPLGMLVYVLISEAKETKKVNEWERTLRQDEEN